MPPHVGSEFHSTVVVLWDKTDDGVFALVVGSMNRRGSAKTEAPVRVDSDLR